MIFALVLALQTDTVVELEKAPDKVEKSDGLGTMGYEHREKEKEFFKKLAKEETTTGSLFADYDIKGKKRGSYVSWFGVVRKAAPVEKAKNEYELLLEHKYFDGLTDSHIMALSSRGGGDFKARVRSKTPPVPRTLMLVRVYGTVAEEKDGVPVLDIEYMRVYPWKTFTFLMAYGEDRTNPEWTKLRKVAEDDIYDPWPDDAYYRNRLGTSEEIKDP